MTHRLSAVLVSLPFAVALAAQDKPAEAMPNPKTPQHERLAALVGTWRTETKMAAMPGVPGMEKASEMVGTEHAELVADYVFSCHTIANLRQIEVGLFKVFPRLKRLVVQTAGQAGQTVQRLTPSASRIVLEP